jgi:Uma2 family endonuclease
VTTRLADATTLDAGDNLSRAQFLSRWEKLPELKFAELIGGIVYMASPLQKRHGQEERRISVWLGVFEAHTPGCEGGSNVTSLIGDDCVQPDDYLAILEEYGGNSWGEKYVEGAPELIAETSFSSASMDLHQKFDLYERAGVQEYLVVLLRKKEVRWHQLVKGRYRRLMADADGIFRSRVFPGLWLDSKAFFRNNMAKVLATLQEGIDSEQHKSFIAELALRKR